MATLKFVSYQGGQIHAERTNKYIADGHGDEVLHRTNRYIAGEHSCGNRCIGVNCPSDPVLASEYMECLRLKYETNLAGRRTKGATSDDQGAAHYQLVISFHTDESISAEERYEVGKELINRTKLKNHAVLLSPHDNTDEAHLHLSTSAFSLDGTHKLCMNNKLLYELRRELDHICVERGYSIVMAPELWGDKDYKEWFDCVWDLEVVTVHPPRPKSAYKETEKEKYAEAKRNEREEDERRKAELEKPRKITKDNRGTRFYGLPFVFSPERPEKQLYIYALDEKGNRKPPLQLDFHLQYCWARACLAKLDKMPDFAGKRDLVKRLTWAQDNAWDAAELVRRLDIGTRGELEKHTKAVGADISKYKQEIAWQDKVFNSAIDECDPDKMYLAQERKRKAEEKLAERSAEYRELKRAEAVQANLTAEHWQEFRRELLGKSASKIYATEAAEKMIRRNYYDIGQLFGIERAEIDAIIDRAKANQSGFDKGKWIVQRGELRWMFAQRSAAVPSIYNTLRDEYAELRELRLAADAYQREFPVYGLVTALLSLVLCLAYRALIAREIADLELTIARTRQLAEDIHYHNQTVQDQFNAAKTRLSLQLINATEQEIALAWRDFERACDEILCRTSLLEFCERGATGGDKTSVVNIDAQIKRELERRPELKQEVIDLMPELARPQFVIVGTRAPDAPERSTRTPERRSLGDMLTSATSRSTNNQPTHRAPSKPRTHE